MAQLSIGLDIGHHHVRAIALAPPSRAQAREGAVARVVATASVPRVDHDGGQKPLAATLAEVETLLGKRGAITVHLGDASTLVRFVPTLPLPPDRRQRLLRLELTQHADEAGDLAADAWEVPIPGDEIVHGCVISQPAQVLAGLQALKTARLGLARIAFGPAALANTAFAAQTAAGDELALVVDIGATITSVALVGDQRLLACRQLSIGGEAFTEALMTGGVDRMTAERRKLTPESATQPASATTIATAVSETALEPLATTIAEPERKRVADASFETLFEDDATIHLTDAPAPAAAATPAAELPVLTFEDDSVARPTVDLQAPAPAPLPLPGSATISIGRKALGPDLQRTAEAFYAQLASSVLWFKTQLRLDDLRIVRVQLTGGGAHLDGLDAYLQRRFNCPVAVLDPFARLATTGIRVPSDGPAWSTAVGLALATPALGGRHALILDLRPESLIRRDFRARYQLWPYIAAGMLVVASAIAGSVLIQQQAAREASLAAYADWKTKREELVKQLGVLDAEKKAQEEDLRAIAGRIYAGRDLLYAVRALKEQAPKSEELWVTNFETRGVAASDVGDGLPSAATASAQTKGYDTAVDRGALLVAGRVKFNAAQTDVGLDQFLKSWRESIAQWKPAPDMPTLFLDQRVVEWDPNHKSSATRPGGKTVNDGEFPFKIKFAFRPTQLDQITATHAAAVKP